MPPEAMASRTELSERSISMCFKLRQGAGSVSCKIRKETTPFESCNFSSTEHSPSFTMPLTAVHSEMINKFDSMHEPPFGKGGSATAKCSKDCKIKGKITDMIHLAPRVWRLAAWDGKDQ